MATKDKGKRKILENQLTFEFFGKLATVIKPIKQKKQENVKVEIKEKKQKAIKRNHIKKNRKRARR